MSQQARGLRTCFPSCFASKKLPFLPNAITHILALILPLN